MSASKIFVAATALSGVSAIQFPQVPLQGPKLPSTWTPWSSNNEELSSRPLVDTKALQDSIKAENLESRAKEFYNIAKLSEDEYNHPTRVIGSDGQCYCPTRGRVDDAPNTDSSSRTSRHALLYQC